MTSAPVRSPELEDIAPDVSGLVTEDDAPVDNIYSEKQQRLLTEALYSSWAGPPPDEESPQRGFVAMANVGVFSSVHEPPVVPDVLLSADVSPHPDIFKKEHRTYFIWEFGKAPDVVIEVVSNREGGELGPKKRRYARMRVTHYVVWDPGAFLDAGELTVFELRGNVYSRAERAWFALLGVGLRVWEGEFEGLHARWLRWCDASGEPLPTGRERADAERVRADAERERADAERARAERLAEKLRALGIDPD